jgi:hypothetical protein
MVNDIDSPLLVSSQIHFCCSKIATEVPAGRPETPWQEGDGVKARGDGGVRGGGVRAEVKMGTKGKRREE